MRELLGDVIRHTRSLGFFDVAKFDSSASKTAIEAMDNDRTVILQAKALTPCADLVGIFGMARFDLLEGFLNFANYKTDTAKMEVKYKDLPNGDSAPEELIFRDGAGQSSTYRFMSAEHIPDIAKFLGASWDVKIQPSRSKWNEFLALASIMQSYETYFLASIVDNNLVFYIGDEDSSSDKTAVTIETDVSGKLTGDLYWDLKRIAPVIKLGIDENLELSISAKGALMLRMTSPLVEYSYLFPARKR